MLDIFTLQTINMTNELGMALKNFRIEHEVTATSIVAEFDKSPTYITKLEKGDIRKMDGDFFINLCNYITQSDNGVEKFLAKTKRNYLEYSNETKLTLKNIDYLLVEHIITTNFIQELNNYMIDHNIIIEQLVEQINENVDLKETNENIIDAPFNILCESQSKSSYFINLNIPITYVKDLFDYKITKIHYIIAEAILYNLYRLGNEPDAHSFATSKLHINNIVTCIGSNMIEINSNQIDHFFGNLQPETVNALQGIASGLKLIVNLTKKNDYGAKHIQQIDSNLRADLGFAFAYMSINIEKMTNKSKDTKQNFLNEVKELIDKYSEDETGVDLYE